MRTVLLTGALLLLTAMSAVAGGVFPYAHTTHTLDNGLKVILIPMPSEGVVAYYSVVRTGSRDEVEPGHSGFAHFFEHMMFRGTEKYPADVYDRIVTSMGADANAYTTDDYTCYHLTFTAPDLPKVIEIEADRFQHLAYAEREFQTEAGAVYGEYRKNRTQPFSVLFEALQDKAFDTHTYKHTTMGFERDIAAMPTMYDYSKSFLQRFYRPENVVIVVAGDFEPAKVMPLIQREYGGWARGYQAPAVPAEPEQTAERSLEVKYEGRTLPMLVMAWKGAGFDPTSREQAAAMLLGDLAFGETSDAYRELVLEQHTVQRLFPRFGNSRDPGLWAVMALVGKEDDIPAVQARLDRAVSELQAAPPDAKRLADLQKRARYGFLMGLDTPDGTANALARVIAHTGGIEAVDTMYETLATVTPADVQAAARKYLATPRRTVAVLKGVKS
jgi:zinc protease